MSETKEKYSEKEQKTSASATDDTATKETTEEGVENTPEEKDDTAKLTAALDELKADNEKQKNDYLRLMAEFDNFRKRTLREKADLLKSGGEQCMRNILPIVDDFERGLLAIGESTDVEAVKEGMTLIYNKFKKYVEHNGVKEIPTKDEEFNTEFHEAVTMYPVEDPEQKGKVMDCVQKGYTLNDKVIRFAKVVVGQ